MGRALPAGAVRAAIVRRDRRARREGVHLRGRIGAPDGHAERGRVGRDDRQIADAGATGHLGAALQIGAGHCENHGERSTADAREPEFGVTRIVDPLDVVAKSVHRVHQGVGDVCQGIAGLDLVAHPVGT